MQHPPADESLTTHPAPVAGAAPRLDHTEYPFHAGPHIPITCTTILHELRPWFRARMPRGVGLVPGRGDAWAAVEFCAWLNQSGGSLPARSWDIEFDVPIHLNPEHRVAMLFNRRATTSAREMIAIGIRVQSLLATPGRFAQGVDAEIGRLQPAALRVPFNTCQRFVLAIATDANGVSALRTRGFETLAALPREMTMLLRGLEG